MAPSPTRWDPNYVCDPWGNPMYQKDISSTGGVGFTLPTITPPKTTFVASAEAFPTNSSNSQALESSINGAGTSGTPSPSKKVSEAATPSPFNAFQTMNLSSPYPEEIMPNYGGVGNMASFTSPQDPMGSPEKPKRKRASKKVSETSKPSPASTPSSNNVASFSEAPQDSMASPAKRRRVSKKISETTTPSPTSMPSTNSPSSGSVYSPPKTPQKRKRATKKVAESVESTTPSPAALSNVVANPDYQFSFNMPANGGNPSSFNVHDGHPSGKGYPSAGGYSSTGMASLPTSGYSIDNNMPNSSPIITNDNFAAAMAAWKNMSHSEMVEAYIAHGKAKIHQRKSSGDSGTTQSQPTPAHQRKSSGDSGTTQSQRAPAHQRKSSGELPVPMLIGGRVYSPFYGFSQDPNVGPQNFSQNPNLRSPQGFLPNPNVGLQGFSQNPNFGNPFGFPQNVNAGNPHGFSLNPHFGNPAAFSQNPNFGNHQGIPELRGVATKKTLMYSLAVPAKELLDFKSLPESVRQSIWKYAIPSVRFFTVSFDKRIPYEDHATMQSKGQGICNHDQKLSGVYLACKESRRVAMMSSITIQPKFMNVPLTFCPSTDFIFFAGYGVLNACMKYGLEEWNGHGVEKFVVDPALSKTIEVLQTIETAKNIKVSANDVHGGLDGYMANVAKFVFHLGKSLKLVALITDLKKNTLDYSGELSRCLQETKNKHDHLRLVAGGEFALEEWKLPKVRSAAYPPKESAAPKGNVGVGNGLSKSFVPYHMRCKVITKEAINNVGTQSNSEDEEQDNEDE